MKDTRTVKKWIALLLKGILLFVVFVFTATESINFFKYVFPEDQWFLSYTGFGLTVGAMIVYLFLFINEAETSLQKTVALIMICAGVLGELLTAGFGMQIQAWKTEGWQMAQSDFTFMVTIVRVMIFAHAVAFLVYSFGDKIISAFQDDDGDGKPNVFDRHDNRKDASPRPQEAPRQAQTYAKDVEAELLPNAHRDGK
jgi:Na+/melibiose symporter-like transporter